MREIHKKTATTTVALLKTTQIRWVCDKYHHSLELIETFFDCLPLFSMHHSDKWQVRSRCLFTFANDLLTLFLYDQILFCSRCQGKHMHRINCVSFWADTIHSLHRRKQKNVDNLHTSWCHWCDCRIYTMTWYRSVQIVNSETLRQQQKISENGMTNESRPSTTEWMNVSMYALNSHAPCQQNIFTVMFQFVYSHTLLGERKHTEMFGRKKNDTPCYWIHNRW